MGLFDNKYLNHIADAADNERSGVTAIPAAYHDAVYEAAGDAAKGTAKGLFSLASSGFGKGALIGAAIIIAAIPIAAGLFGAAELLTFKTATEMITTGEFVAAGKIVPFSEAVIVGIVSIPGVIANAILPTLAAIGLSGVAGSIYTVTKENDKTRADLAKQEALMLQRIRDEKELALSQQQSTGTVQQAQQQPAPAPAPPEPQKPQESTMGIEEKKPNFAAREMARRSSRSANIVLGQS